jgi:mannosyltransferase
MLQETARLAGVLYRARQLHVLALLAITALAAGLRFATLGHQSFWFDEVDTVSLVRKSFSGMLADVPRIENTPPLYFVLAWFWSKLFGTSEIGLRSLSALAGTLTVPVVYLAGTVLVSRRVGLLVAALAATSPVLVWYSQEARSYALFVLFASLSFLYFVRALGRATRQTLIPFTVFSILALCTHYFAIFFVTVEVAGLLLAHGVRRSIVVSGAAAGAVGLALLPLASHQTPHANYAGWIHAIPLQDRLAEAIRMLSTPAPAPLWAGAGTAGFDSRGLWWIAALVLSLALASLLVLGSYRERRGGLIALGVGSASLAIPLVLGALGEAVAGRGDFFLGRNALAAWLPLAIVVAAGLGAERVHFLGPAAVGVICAASLAVVLATVFIPGWQRDDWRFIARHLAEPAVVVKPAYHAEALRQYDAGLVPMPPAGVRLRELSFLLHLDGRRLPVNVPEGFTRVRAERLQNWTLVRFRSVTPVRVRPADLGPPAGILVADHPLRQ